MCDKDDARIDTSAMSGSASLRAHAFATRRGPYQTSSSLRVAFRDNTNGVHAREAQHGGRLHKKGSNISLVPTPMVSARAREAAIVASRFCFVAAIGGPLRTRSVGRVTVAQCGTELGRVSTLGRHCVRAVLPGAVAPLSCARVPAAETISTCMCAQRQRKPFFVETPGLKSIARAPSVRLAYCSSDGMSDGV